MDPGLPNARAGTSSLVLLFLILAPSLVAAPWGGQASKTLRAFHASPAAPSEPSSEPVPVAQPDVVDGGNAGVLEVDAQPPELSSPSLVVDETAAVADEPALLESFDLSDASEETPPAMNALPPAGIVSQSPPETLAPAVAPEPVTAATHPQWKTAGNARAYLPNGGPLPLRFAEPKRWPAPLPAEVVRHEGETAVAASSSDIADADVSELDAAGYAPGGETDAEAAAGSPSMTTQQASYSKSGDAGQAVLTADLVLGYISGVSGGGGMHRDSFLPAMSSSDAGGSSSAGARSQP